MAFFSPSVVWNRFQQASVVLLDFNGPLCDLFARLPASRVANRLAMIGGADLRISDDPLEILRFAAKKLTPGELCAVEDALVAAELEAIEGSITEPAGLELVRGMVARQLQVGIVSNNSSKAVKAFLKQQGLSAAVPLAIGRAYSRPDRMTPHPWVLLEALQLANVSARNAVFIGDSAADLAAAHEIQVPCIVVEKDPAKVAYFEPWEIVATSMREVLDAYEAKGFSRVNPKRPRQFSRGGDEVDYFMAIVCTDRGQHKKTCLTTARRDLDGTHGMSRALEFFAAPMADAEPNSRTSRQSYVFACPRCRRTPQVDRRRWWQIVDDAARACLDEIDISLLS